AVPRIVAVPFAEPVSSFKLLLRAGPARRLRTVRRARQRVLGLVDERLTAAPLQRAARRVSQQDIRTRCRVLRDRDERSRDLHGRVRVIATTRQHGTVGYDAEALQNVRVVDAAESL